MDSFLVPLGFFATAVLIVWIVFRFIENEKKRRYDLVAQAIEKGQQLPDNIFAPQEKPEKKSFSYFKNAIIFLALSLAFWAVFIYQVVYHVGETFPMLFLAAFFTAFGAAWLAIGFMKLAAEKREKEEK